MTDVRFYTDEHVAKAVAAGLRLRGIDVVTTHQAGMLGASDEQHLAFALSQGRVLVTQDDDFIRLSAGGAPHAGIVYAPQQTPVGEIIRGLTLIYHVLAVEEIAGNTEFI